MRTSTTFAIVAGIFSLYADAIQLHERAGGSSRVVEFSIQRKSVPNPLFRDRLRRRASTVQATLNNEETLYFMNATLGTPAQKVRLQIDTGSSDLWVNTPTSQLCRQRGRPCAYAGTYTANSSSTYSYISSDFDISYVDGSGSSGDYVADTFSFDGTTLASLQFGIGYESSSDQGILGIGYQINEVQVGRDGEAAYNNLPQQLVADGLIQSNAYSLWLNDLDANTGSILFGGVDTEQYVGSLETLPIQPYGGYFSEFLITLTDVTLGDTVIAESQALAVLLDSGSSLTYLPDAWAEAIFDQVSAEYNSQEGAYYVRCSLADNSTTLDFKFTSPTISVAMDELVIPVTGSNGRQPTFSDGSTACLFGIYPVGNGTVVLGDTFIRSAYVVYDLSNNEISIAQTNFNATSTNVLEIGTGASSVPDATGVANPANAATGVKQGATSTARAERTAAPMKVGAMAAVGLGMAYMAM